MVILIAGRIGSGKDTFADMLSDYLINKGVNSYSGRFAELPKRQCAQIMGVDWESFNSHDNPNKSLYRKMYREHAEKLKEVYGNDVWSKALRAKYNRDGGVMIVRDCRFQHELDAFSDIDSITVKLERYATLDDWAKIYGEGLQTLSKIFGNGKVSMKQIAEKAYLLNDDNLTHTILAKSELSVDSLETDYELDNDSGLDTLKWFAGIIGDLIIQQLNVN